LKTQNRAHSKATEDEFESKLSLLSTKSTRKKQRQDSSETPVLNPIQEIIRLREQRKLTEAKTLEREKQKDEQELIKPCFDTKDDEEEKLLNSAINSQEKLQEELFRTDGPLPKGYFARKPQKNENYNENEVEDEGKSNFSNAEKGLIGPKELTDGSFASSFFNQPNSSELTCEQCDFLLECVFLDENQDISTSAFDTFLSLILGDVNYFFTSKGTVMNLPSMRRVGEKLLPKETKLKQSWKLTLEILKFSLKNFLARDFLPSSNATRGLKLLEILLCYELIDLENLNFICLELIHFGCFEKPMQCAEEELRCCLNEIGKLLLRHGNKDWMKKNGGKEIAKICLSSGDGEGETSSVRNVLLDRNEDPSLYRAVHICNLLSKPNCLAIQFLFLRSFLDLKISKLPQELTETEADDDDDQVRSMLIQRLFAFLKSDIGEIQLIKNKRKDLQPFHFHRWQSFILMIDLLARYSNSPDWTPKMLFSQLRDVQDSIERTYLVSYTNLIDCIRFVKRQHESTGGTPHLGGGYLDDDGRVQTKLPFAFSQKKREE
jgi:hypothetical protein